MARMTELSNYLASENVEVHVLACKKNKTWDGLLNLSKNVDVEFIKSLWNYKDTSEVANKNNATKKKNKNALLLNVLKKINRLFLRNYLIDRHQLSNQKYIKEAESLILNRNIKNIIVSGPRNSIYLVGMELKKTFNTNINLISDYRDGWTVRSAFYKEKKKTAISKFKIIEQQILKHNDYSVFVSEGMQSIYEKEFKVGKSLVIENGFIEYRESEYLEQEEFSALINKAKEESRIIIGYFGTGSTDGSIPYKDFSNLLNLFEKYPLLSEKFCLISQGRVNYASNTPKNLMIGNLNGTTNEFARANMKLVDILLFVYSDINDAPMAMGGKLYDYMASGRPIWLLAPNNSDSLKSFAIKTTKPIFSDINEEASIIEGLQKIAELIHEGKLSEKGFTNDEISIHSRSNQYKKFLEILE